MKSRTTKGKKMDKKNKNKHKSTGENITLSEKPDKKDDIIEIILQEHKPLKKLIKIMKDSDKHSLTERRAAFEKFGPLLVMHAKPEEKAWYEKMKLDKELREEAFEGDVEHGLADQMLEEAKRTKDKDLWSARVKVLAELVEHHIKEEEEDILPDYRKHSKLPERVAVGKFYWEAKQNIKPDGNSVDPRQ